jgi:hypothetical protein
LSSRTDLKAFSAKTQRLVEPFLRDLAAIVAALEGIEEVITSYGGVPALAVRGFCGARLDAKGAPFALASIDGNAGWKRVGRKN